MRHPPSARPALTLLELVIVLVIIGLLSVIAVREAGHYLDRLAARTAVSEAAEVIHQARDEALALHALVSVRIDTARDELALRSRGRSMAVHALGHAHGVALFTSRDSLAFDVNAGARERWRSRSRGDAPARYRGIVGTCDTLPPRAQPLRCSSS